MRNDRRVWSVLAAAVAVLLWPGHAAGHAKLLRADPQPGSTVTAPPAHVRLVFALSPGEELDVQRSRISVWSSAGRRVDDGKGGVDLDDLDRRTLVARLLAIGPGTYTVRWQAVSAPDLGVAQGTYTFTVAAAGARALPPLRIVYPRNGAVVANPVTVVFETPADLSKMTVRHGTDMHGSTTAMPHLHIELDRRQDMPMLKHLVRVGPQRYRYVLGTVAPGRHVLRISWADAQHRTIKETVRTVTFTVR
ncbi:MAG: copper resistance protein CopC [Armatimonadota bacterium]|nr:copper resistance protein CopC [Armatimonadota bacterium]